jgi:hypothetical protein
MKLSMRELMGFRLDLADGHMGAVYDFFIDDTLWNIRYVVARTGPWLFGRKVLIAPSALGKADAEKHALQVNHTKEQIKNSPGVDTEKPVSRQHEIDLHRHYQWIPYWAPHGAMEPAVIGSPVPPEEEEDAPSALERGDPHLRSVREMMRYSLRAEDGETVADIFDFIVDDEDWTISDVAIDRGLAAYPKLALIPSNRIVRVDWNDRSLFTTLTSDEVEQRPIYDPGAAVNAEFVVERSDYLGRPHERTRL